MATHRRGGSLRDLRRANLTQTLSLLRIQGPLTQAEISRLTGLSHASVSNIVRDLLGEGLVNTTQARRNGRRVTEVSLNASSGLVGGIDFGNHHVRAAVADHAHAVREEAFRRLPYGHEAAASIHEAAAMFRDLVAATGRELGDVRVLAVGLPGPMDRASGSTTSPAILPGWADFSVTSAFHEALGVRTVVDNDANLGALAEGSWGAGRGFTDFAYVKVSTGIGAGLVLNGRLYRGVAGTAGEVGHTTIEEDGPLCRCGNRGCLEMFAAAPAIVDIVRRGIGTPMTIEDVLRLSDEGDVGCRRVITDAGRHIGVALANLCNLLSPQVIIIGGELALAGDVLLTAIRESMGRRAVSVPAQSAAVVTSVLGERASVLGALVLALQESGAEDDPRHTAASSFSGSQFQFPLAG